MLAQLKSIVRAASVATLLFALAIPAAAQTTKTDGRWQPWLGCWSPSGTLIRVVGKSSANVVCVVPSTTASSVDVITVADGEIVDRTHVDTDGQPHTITKEGCTGWQSAKWSPSARRVYLKSEFNCAGAPSTKTNVSAVYAMAGAGEWIDVQGMRVEKNSGVHSVRYREALDPGALPPEITQKLQPRTLSKMAAMLAVITAPTLADVEEASRELDPSVVSTWLIETDQLAMQRPEPLKAKQLVQLADNGVPASVIDVMVGLSYPREFAVNPANDGQIARQGSDGLSSESGGAYSGYGDLGLMSSLSPIIGFDRFGAPIYAAELSNMSSCSPFAGYGPYDLGWSTMYSQLACSRYGYSPFGAYGGYGAYDSFGAYGYGGYPGYYGGGYYGGGPVVTPIATPGSGTASHGRVVNGHGYSQGTSAGTQAHPSGSVSPASSSSGGGASSPPARTAQPRKP